MISNFEKAWFTLNGHPEPLGTSPSSSRGTIASGRTVPPPKTVHLGARRRQTSLATATCAGRIVFRTFQAPRAFYAQAARVRVDLKTGRVDVLDLAAVHDVGNVVNRLGAEGQIRGRRRAQVWAWRCSKSDPLRSRWTPEVNTGVNDYKLPTAGDVPLIKVELLEYPAIDGGPRGLKGISEQAGRGDGRGNRQRDRGGDG